MNAFKQILLITTAFLALFVVQSCTKDDYPGPEEPVQTLELEGRWTITSVNFLNNAANWKENVPFTSESGLGWAPNMFAKTMGINFQTTTVNNDSGTKLGSKFSFIVGEDLPLSENDTYWYWNYADEQLSFEMKQLITASLPYDFTLHDIREVTIENEGDKVVFKADVNSRKPGEDVAEIIQVPVEVTIVRGVPSVESVILSMGHPFVMPELELTEEENQAELIAELKQAMGFNSNQVHTLYMPATFYFMTPIEGVDWDLIEYVFEGANDNHMPSAPFVVIDKKNRLYFHMRNTGSWYEKFKITKEGNLYTLMGEHADAHTYAPGLPDDTTHRIKVTFDAETTETLVIRELFSESDGTVYIDYIISWTKDETITTHSFNEEYNPYPELDV